MDRVERRENENGARAMVSYERERGETLVLVNERLR